MNSRKSNNRRNPAWTKPILIISTVMVGLLIASFIPPANPFHDIATNTILIGTGAVAALLPDWIGLE